MRLIKPFFLPSAPMLTIAANESALLSSLKITSSLRNLLLLCSSLNSVLFHVTYSIIVVGRASLVFLPGCRGSVSLTNEMLHISLFFHSNISFVLALRSLLSASGSQKVFNSLRAKKERRTIPTFILQPLRVSPKVSSYSKMYYNGIDNSPMLLLLLYDSQWKLSVFASLVQGDARAKWDPETVEKFDEKSLLNLILFSQTALSFQFAFSFSSVRSCFILKKRKVQTFWFGLRRTMRKEFSVQLQNCWNLSV